MIKTILPFNDQEYTIIYYTSKFTLNINGVRFSKFQLRSAKFPLCKTVKFEQLTQHLLPGMLVLTIIYAKIAISYRIDLTAKTIALMDSQQRLYLDNGTTAQINELGQILTYNITGLPFIRLGDDIEASVQKIDDTYHVLYLRTWDKPHDIRFYIVTQKHIVKYHCKHVIIYKADDNAAETCGIVLDSNLTLLKIIFTDIFDQHGHLNNRLLLRDIKNIYKLYDECGKVVYEDFTFKTPRIYR